MFFAILLLNSSFITGSFNYSYPRYQVKRYQSSYVWLSVRGGNADYCGIYAYPSEILSYNSSLKKIYEYPLARPSVLPPNETYEAGVDIIINYCKEINETWSSIYIALIMRNNTQYSPALNVYHELQPEYICPTTYPTQENEIVTFNSTDLEEPKEPKWIFELIIGLILCPILYQIGVYSIRRWKEYRKSHTGPIVSEKSERNDKIARKRKRQRNGWTEEALRRRFPNLKK